MAVISTSSLIDELLDKQGAIGLKAFAQAVMKQVIPSLHDTDGVPGQIVANTYHADELTVAQNELARIINLSDEDCEREARAEFEAEKAEFINDLSEVKKLSARLGEGFEFVQRYEKALESNAGERGESGSEQKRDDADDCAVNVARLMERQITDAFKRAAEHKSFCEGRLALLKPISGAEWKQKKKEEVERSIAYHTKELASDASRLARDNQAIILANAAIKQALKM